MGLFDTPNQNYGSYSNPVRYFTEVNEDQVQIIKSHCAVLEISADRVFLTSDEEIQDFIRPGIIVYYPQYNAVRNSNKEEGAEFFTVSQFIKKLVKHPKNMGSRFVKCETIEQRDEVIKYLLNLDYRKMDLPLHYTDLAILINEKLKIIIMHSNATADANEREGNYPCVIFDQFKMYMQ